MDRHAFGNFYAQLASQTTDLSYYLPVEPLVEAGEDVYSQPYLDSYGGSIQDVILIHQPPLELFHPGRDLTLRDPVLMNNLARVRNVYHRRVGSWGMVSPCLRYDRALKGLRFVTNLIGIDRATYDDVLIPAYDKLRRYCGLRKVKTCVGSWDSFVNLDPAGTRKVIQRLLEPRSDGLAILLQGDGPRVEIFEAERNLGCGVLPETRQPYDPVIVGAMAQGRGLARQLQSLLERDASENELEEFLVANYQQVFGRQYSHVESQVWLRCPAADIRGSERRLDLFLRNSVTSDWELFEIKRPVRLTTNYRNVPILTKEVIGAIQQTENYLRLLSQDVVKRRLRNMGIDYCEPVATIVIGRSPSIPIAEWRWLKSTSQHQVRIATFDELIAEWQCRLKDRHDLLEYCWSMRAEPSTI
jgi:hypothetical protein